MPGYGRCWLNMGLRWTSRRICRLESLHCLWRRRWLCFAVCFRGARMYLLGDGSVQRQARAAINLCALGSEAVSIAIRKNSNAPNVRTANFNLWDTVTYTVTSKGRIQMDAMLLAYMPYCRTIPADSYVVISMTRIASMVIKRMLWHTSVFAATGEFRLIQSGRGRAMALMSGFCLTNISKLRRHGDWVMQF